MNFYAFPDDGAHPRIFKKLLLVMKLTIILIVAALLQVHAATIAQTVTLNKKNIPLSQVFKEIKKQTGYDFLYSPDMIEQAKPVTINVAKAPLETVLQECFAGQPLTYTIDQQTIVVRRKEMLTQPATSLNKVPIEVTGTVVDEQNRPVPGATVTVKGTSNAAITDAKGEFTLKNVASNAAIVISFVGYQKQELPAAADLGKIKLMVASNELDAVQVIAYGETTARLTTGDISSVSAKEIEQQPVDNPLLALEGRVPGLVITQNSGVAGGGVTVQIQGVNSMTRGTDPLYVIDGVPYSSQPMSNLSGPFGVLGSNGNQNSGTQTGGGSPLNFINPADIESIEILKDASATSIYGSRAANGAILITTKKGKAGATNVNANVQDGWGQITRMLPELNTQQYLEMRHEAFKNDGLTPGPGDYDINGAWDTTRYTNWQKLLIGNTAEFTNANVSVSGGSTNTQFLVGAGYNRQTSVFPGDFADQKGSFHVNLNNSSPNQRFKLQTDIKYLVDNNTLPTVDLTQTAISLSPDAPPVYTPNGALNWAPVNGVSTWYNPLAYLNETYNTKTGNLLSNALISYEIIPGLILKSTFGYNNLSTNEYQLNPLSALAPDLAPSSQSNATYNSTSVETWIIEPQITYKRSIAKGTLDALLGSTIQQTTSKQQEYLGLGYPSDLLLQSPGAATTTIPFGTVNSLYRYSALFGRINYNWEDKYILELTARNDGSSRFGPANEFHTFGSIAGAWLFSNEHFLTDNLSFLSFGKLRVSYGTTGNDQIGDYQFASVYNPLPAAVAYQGVTALVPGGLSNPYLQWEETRKLQFGLDLGFLKDRISVNANYYINRSSNLLQNYALPIITGFTQITENFPAVVQNSGLELMLNSVNIKSANFTWKSGFNVTLPKNKLVSFPNLATSSYANTYVIGQPITIQRLPNFVGVNPSTGIAQFLAASGNLVSTPQYPGDYYEYKNLSPTLYGGFQNSIQYRAFTLDFLFSFEKHIAQSDQFGNYPGTFFSGNASYNLTFDNQPIYVLQRWQNPGNTTLVQKFSTQYFTTYADYGYYANSQAAYTDASFIRLKNLSFSYELPAQWKNSLHLHSAKLYLQGQNLLTFTKFKGMDPENTTLSNIPPLKMLTPGVQIGL